MTDGGWRLMMNDWMMSTTDEAMGCHGEWPLGIGDFTGHPTDQRIRMKLWERWKGGKGGIVGGLLCLLHPEYCTDTQKQRAQPVKQFPRGGAVGNAVML
jgi:hypothetical protein